jgi:hypothetical protein
MEWDSTHGSGGGGGGAGFGGAAQAAVGNGGAGGLYGGGGGSSSTGGSTSRGNGGDGAQGIIVITYTPAATNDAYGQSIFRIKRPAWRRVIENIRPPVPAWTRASSGKLITPRRRLPASGLNSEATNAALLRCNKGVHYKWDRQYRDDSFVGENCGQSGDGDDPGCVCAHL